MTKGNAKQVGLMALTIVGTGLFLDFAARGYFGTYAANVSQAVGRGYGV